ncbi:hypothetical protein J4E90_008787 [Alternaria incomplexa]|uniref:uncharacterized protein n=1 Tax=Alternaria incomplexa TaxID=1187928 RepID=UPI00221F494C|nr:uncharacterized protein J4E90_008787 [Alternaria incomplexa]KAI4908163.1 hypothetical protein J4E90_008787 [Alternaria incomplexa]
MASLLSTMLFAASASAQVTTSFWMPSNGLGTDNIGFVGSVINANETHTTVAVEYDEGTDLDALSIGVNGPMTMTIGPEYYGTTVDVGIAGSGDDDEDDTYALDCTWPTPEEAGSNRTCTVSYPPGLASLLCQNTAYISTTEEIWTRTHTYPARGSEPAGTETVRQTFSYGYGSAVSSVSQPAYCSESGAPDEPYVSEVEIEATQFGTYYLVITAGTEKLEATAAATATMSSAMSTGAPTNATGASGTAPVPEVTEAGAPMVRGAPLLAGLGAAAAAFFV